MPRKYIITVAPDRILSIDIDGVHYDRPDQIPDATDRERILGFMSAAPFDKDSETSVQEPAIAPSSSSDFASNLIVGIFLAVAGLMLTIAVRSGLGTMETLAQEKTAPGRVVEMVLRKDSDDQEYYYPKVRFCLPDETCQTVQLTEGSWPAAYQTGDPVTVAYHPDRPREAQIQSSDRAVALWALPAITGFLGIAFAIASLAAFWVIRAEVKDSRRL